MGQMIGSKSRKGCQGYLLSPCLFNLYAKHIMRNARLDELQAGIKIGRRNIDDLRDAYDTTLMAESEEEPKSLLMRVKEESERASLRLNIKNLRPWHRPITSWQIEEEEVEAVTEPLSLGSEPLQTVTAAMESEDDCFSSGKQRQTQRVC